MSPPLNFHLEQYEGPLDLLLDLIRKQQIDIKDIPIATITSQYLEFMDKAREMDIDLGAEFVYMAATLIHIKSKMLLPRDPALAPEGERPPTAVTRAFKINMGGFGIGLRQLVEHRDRIVEQSEFFLDVTDCVLGGFTHSQMVGGHRRFRSRK